MSSLKAAAKFKVPSKRTVDKWERIYLEEGALALFKDNRGRSKGMKDKNHKKPPLSEQVKEDLISENQRLRMENEYLKKLNALIQEQERSAKKTR